MQLLFWKKKNNQSGGESSKDNGTGLKLRFESWRKFK